MRRLICIVITVLLVTVILLSAVSDINYGYGSDYVPAYNDAYNDAYNES